MVYSVFVGPPGAGKSTLINMIAENDVTHVSHDIDKDGTTEIRKFGDYIDTPGLCSGDDVRSVNSIGLKEALQGERSCRLILVLPRHTTRITKWWDLYIRIMNALFGNCEHINVILTHPAPNGFDPSKFENAIKRKCKSAIVKIKHDNDISDLSSFEPQDILYGDNQVNPRPVIQKSTRVPKYKISAEISPNSLKKNDVGEALVQTVSLKSSDPNQFERLVALGNAFVLFRTMLVLHARNDPNPEETAERLLKGLCCISQSGESALEKCDLVKAVMARALVHRNTPIHNAILQDIFKNYESPTNPVIAAPPSAESGLLTPSADSGLSTPSADSGLMTPSADSGLSTPSADSGLLTESSQSDGCDESEVFKSMPQSPASDNVVAAGWFHDYVDRQSAPSKVDFADIMKIVTAVVHKHPETSAAEYAGSKSKHIDVHGYSDVDIFVHCVSEISKRLRKEISTEILTELRKKNHKKASLTYCHKATAYDCGKRLSFDLVFEKSGWIEEGEVEPPSSAKYFHDRGDLQRAVRALKLLSKKKPEKFPPLKGHLLARFVVKVEHDNPSLRQQDPSGYQLFIKCLESTSCFLLFMSTKSDSHALIEKTSSSAEEILIRLRKNSDQSKTESIIFA